MKIRSVMEKTGAKIAAFILCIFFAAATALGLLGILFLTGQGAYDHSERYFRDELLRGIISEVGYRIVRCAELDDEDGIAYFADSNLLYELSVRVNGGAPERFATNCEGSEPEWTYESTYAILTGEWVDAGDVAAMPDSSDEPEIATGDSKRCWQMVEREYSIRAALRDGLPARDRFALVSGLAGALYALRYGIYAIVLVTAALCIASFILLLLGAGRRKGSDEVRAGLLTRVPFDLFLFTAAVLAIVPAAALSAAFSEFGDVAGLMLLGTYCVYAACIALGCCVSAAVRVKNHTWWRNTVIYRALALIGRAARKLWRGAGRLVRALPLVWKTAVGYGALCLLELFGIAGFGWNIESLLLFWVIEKLVLGAAVIFFALMLRRLQRGGQALAAGELSYQVDTKHMVGGLRSHGENLNSIAAGMERAVDERMRSERFRTELITNDSHDIKTPLTSIINYADLITREPTDNEKIHEYCAVLTRQSERLKKLIEDLVEASKASTGNVEAQLAPCQISVLLTQAAGEYEKRLAAAELTLVTQQTDESVRIMADGRLLWRVLDNLMNNACKYAQPGTRVYLTLEKQGGDAVISLKNISREELGIPAHELLERFVRGDSARATEGSGLGLSIAQSLTELQGGQLELAIDGDLFKVTLRFPCID
mgnify:FL=1